MEFESEELLTLTRLPSLQLRCLAAVLCHLFKILHNLTDFPNNPATKRNMTYSSRTVNCFTLVPYQCRTSFYKFSFFPHAITIWNRLVSHKDFTLVDCTSISSFKLMHAERDIKTIVLVSARPPKPILITKLLSNTLHLRRNSRSI